MSDIPITINVSGILDPRYSMYVCTSIVSPILLTLPLSTSTNGIHFDIVNASNQPIFVAANPLNSIAGGSPNIAILSLSRQRLTSIAGVWYGYVQPVTTTTTTDIQMNSNGDLVAGAFMYSPSAVGALPILTSEINSQRVCTKATVLKNLTVHLTAPPGLGSSRIFTVRNNGIPTALTVVMGATDINVTNSTTQVSFAQFDLISVQHLTTGAVTSQAVVSVQMY